MWIAVTRTRATRPLTVILERDGSYSPSKSCWLNSEGTAWRHKLGALPQSGFPEPDRNEWADREWSAWL